MSNILISSGANPPSNTGTDGVFSVEFSAITQSVPTGFLFNVNLDVRPANPVPSMKTAIENEAINQVQQLGGTFAGSDKVVFLVEPTL